MKAESGAKLKIEFSGKAAPHILRILARTKPASVTLDGAALVEGQAWNFETGEQHLIIKTGEYANGNYLVSWW